MIKLRRYIPLIALIGCILLVQNKLTHPKKPIRVYTSMVGDLFHFGHVELLRQAKSFGDYLIVGLISDEVATPYKRKPILTLKERTNTMKGCKYIDEVIPGTPLTVTKDFIKKHKIDVVVHGDDFNMQKIERFLKDPHEKGILKIVPYTKGISTTTIINRIKSRNY